MTRRAKRTIDVRSWAREEGDGITRRRENGHSALGHLRKAGQFMLTVVHDGKMYAFPMAARSIDARKNDSHEYAMTGHPCTVTLGLVQLRPAQQIDAAPAPDTSVRDAVEANR